VVSTKATWHRSFLAHSTGTGNDLYIISTGPVAQGAQMASFFFRFGHRLAPIPAEALDEYTFEAQLDSGVTRLVKKEFQDKIKVIYA
jgi:hypothetical protein